MTETTITLVIKSTSLCREAQNYTHAGSNRRALPLKDRKTLGAERGSLEGSSAAPDDKPSRASSQQSLSHNIVPLFVNRAGEESRKLRGRWR